MDGYALGRTKVFLKYYHIEYLAKQYERQIRCQIRNASFSSWLTNGPNKLECLSLLAFPLQLTGPNLKLRRN